MKVLRGAWLIFMKDLRVELRTGEIVITTGLFASLVAVLASLSFYVGAHSAKMVAPGVLWIAVSFAGVLAMSRSWAREREHDAIRGLLLSPVPRASIYLGKALGTLVFLSVVEVVLLLEVGVLFNLDLVEVLLPLSLLLFLGTIGFVVTGNLFAFF